MTKLIIYGIFDKEGNSVYIGKTTTTLDKRLRGHHFFKKGDYPENKGRSNYNVRVIKEMLLLPECNLKTGDYEGYFIQKYKDNFYNILNKQDVPFKNPFDIDNMLKTEIQQRQNYPEPEPELNYDLPNHVFKYSADEKYFGLEKRIKYITDYLTSLHNQGKRCEWLDMYMDYTYFSKGKDIPDNWFELMITSSRYIPFKEYTLKGKPINNDIKL